MTALRDMTFSEITDLVSKLQSENHSLKLKLTRKNIAIGRRDAIIERETGKTYSELRSRL